MGLFGGKTKADPTSELILAEIEKLSKDVAKLKGEKQATTDLKKLDEEYATAKRELTDLQITLDRVKEDHERETREIEHKVGLQKKKQTFEVDAAKREAIVTVREENLDAKEKRFDEHVKFIEDRFDQQFDALRELTNKILDRMPETKQLIHVGAPNGNGNGTDTD